MKSEILPEGQQPIGSHRCRFAPAYSRQGPGVEIRELTCTASIRVSCAGDIVLHPRPEGEIDGCLEQGKDPAAIGLE